MTIIRKITTIKMKAVIATESISLLPLRGRHHPFTRPRAATLSVAITAYTFIFGVILRIIISTETVSYMATIVVNEKPHSESA